MDPKWSSVIQKMTYLSILDDQKNSKFYAKVENIRKRICHFFGERTGTLVSALGNSQENYTVTTKVYIRPGLNKIYGWPKNL